MLFKNLLADLTSGSVTRAFKAIITMVLIGLVVCVGILFLLVLGIITGLTLGVIVIILLIIACFVWPFVVGWSLTKGGHLLYLGDLGHTLKNIEMFARTSGLGPTPAAPPSATRRKARKASGGRGTP